MVAVGQLEDQPAAGGPADRLDLDAGGMGALARKVSRQLSQTVAR